MIIAIDFDGTCTTHDYPEIGTDIGAVKVLRALVNKNHDLILYTMRSKKELQDSVNWFADNEIPLFGIQTNPTQLSWTESPKCYAQLYIDDAALGCPLIYPAGGRPYVNWNSVEKMLVERKIL